MDANTCDAVDTASPPCATAHPRPFQDRPTHHVPPFHHAPTSLVRPNRTSALTVATSRAFSTVHAHDCTAHIRYSPVRPAKPCAYACHSDTPTRPASRQAPTTHHTSPTPERHAKPCPCPPVSTPRPIDRAVPVFTGQALNDMPYQPRSIRNGGVVIFGGVEARSGVGTRRLQAIDDVRGLLQPPNILAVPAEVAGNGHLLDAVSAHLADGTAEVQARSLDDLGCLLLGALDLGEGGVEGGHRIGHLLIVTWGSASLSYSKLIIRPTHLSANSRVGYSGGRRQTQLSPVL